MEQGPNSDPAVATSTVADGRPSASPVRDAAEERRWRRIRRRAALGYAAALIVLVLTVGVPTDRGSLLLVILAGLAIPCLGKGWRAYRQVLLDWLPFTAVLVVYDVSRGLATWVGLPLHMSDIAAADRALFGGTVPTVWLQDHFLHPGAPTWYDALATLVYITHFLATPIVAAVLWLRNRQIWIQFVSRVIVLSVAGLVTYVLFPPRLRGTRRVRASSSRSSGPPHGAGSGCTSITRATCSAPASWRPTRSRRCPPCTRPSPP